MANPIMALWRRYFSFAVCYEEMLDPTKHYLFADYPHGAFPLSQLLALTVRHLACWQGEKGSLGCASKGDTQHHVVQKTCCCIQDDERTNCQQQEQQLAQVLFPHCMLLLLGT